MYKTTNLQNKKYTTKSYMIIFKTSKSDQGLLKRFYLIDYFSADGEGLGCQRL